jgi:DNA-binding FadR family transcriptional regulator
VARRGLHRDVVDALGFRIVDGEFAPGASLPNELLLSTELAVSRTVVREAIKVLASKGLVESRPKTGTRVLPRDRWDVLDGDVLNWRLDVGVDVQFFRDLAEVRSLVEPRAAALAAMRRTPGELQSIDEALHAMRSSGDDLAAYVEADLGLHLAILGAAHNELLRRLSGVLAAAIEAGRLLTPVPVRRAEVLPLHEEVVTAIRAGEAVAARAGMDRLVRTAAETVERLLGETSASASPGRVPTATR